VSRPRFARRLRGRRALTLAFAPRLIIQLSGGCQILVLRTELRPSRTAIGCRLAAAERRLPEGAEVKKEAVIGFRLIFQSDVVQPFQEAPGKLQNHRTFFSEADLGKVRGWSETSRRYGSEPDNRPVVSPLFQSA